MILNDLSAVCVCVSVVLSVSIHPVCVVVLQDCSVLAFVLDHLLPHTQNSEDKDTPALARLFLASLAAAGTGTDAQVALVNEVKAALSRALAMAEGTEKHAR